MLVALQFQQIISSSIAIQATYILVLGALQLQHFTAVCCFLRSAKLPLAGVWYFGFCTCFTLVTIVSLNCVCCWLAGNVARFINHSCRGNLVIQPVFTDGCNALLYRIALFASEEIAAYTELTYDYGYAEGVVHNRLMQCKCGSDQCRKRLL